MIDDVLIRDAIRSSGVKRVIVIDDAFDRPAFPESEAALILEWLEGEGSGVLAEAGVEAERRTRSVSAIANSAFDDPDLVGSWDALYAKFLLTFETRYDPAGLFDRIKGDNLRNLRPLLTLLRSCDWLKIDEIGAGDDIEGSWDDANVVFVDYILDERVKPSDDAIAGSSADVGKQAARERVTSLMRKARAGEAPSVILMSSHDDLANHAEAFRTKVGESGKTRVFASRFCFIRKKALSLKEATKVTVERDEAHKLLDLFQSYGFGKGVQTTLDRWHDAAGAALADLRRDVEGMDLKDFAYLVRFRLTAEGTPLIDYLEWFFGECLLDYIARRVDAGGVEPQLEERDSERLQGIFVGATGVVADLYHKVRVEAPRPQRRLNYRLGDLFRGETDTLSIIAVLTPDCDLIQRKDGRIARALLTVRGKLKRLDPTDAKCSADNFVKVDDMDFNVRWDKKDIETWPFDGWPDVRRNDVTMKYVGTLRALYAQQLQRDVLHDLGRVGVAVAPTMAMSASLRIEVRSKSGTSKVIDLKGTQLPSCHIFPGRGTDRPRILFNRRYAYDLIAKLEGEREGLRADVLDERAFDTSMALILKPTSASSIVDRMTLDGCELESAIWEGVYVSLKPKPGTQEGKAAWCLLLVSATAAAEGEVPAMGYPEG